MTATLQNGSQADIRSSEPADARDVLEFSREIAEEDAFSLLAPDEFQHNLIEQVVFMENHRLSPGKLHLLALVGGRVVGSLDFANGNRRRIAHTGQFGMAILKEFRGIGLGKALLQVFILWARENPLIEKVSLLAHANNTRALHLYEQAGFVVEGIRKRELKVGASDYIDTIVMAMDVR